MSKVIFSFEKIDTTMSCSKDELMKDICQKYAKKKKKNIDSLRFSYDEKEINFQLSFEKLVNEKDKEKNEMKIFVYKNENNQYRCPKCGEKVKLKTEKLEKKGKDNESIQVAIKAFEDLCKNMISDIENEKNVKGSENEKEFKPPVIKKFTYMRYQFPSDDELPVCIELEEEN